MAHDDLLIVTGGSRGIGAATALQAAAAGWRVAVTYREDAAAAEAVVRAIAEAGGVASAHALDVADAAGVDAVFAELNARYGPHALGGLVNNAGIVAPAARLDAMSNERLRRMFDVNVLGTMYCSRAAVRRMSVQHGGRGGAIVNVGSIAARLGSPAQYVDYAASKGAVDVLTIGLARELAPDRIRVNIVRPGIVDTEIHASGGEPDRAARMGPQIPVGRAGTADEIAATILFLLGPQSSYTTGAIVDVSGGR